jgi:hypothetical protein
VKIEEKYLLYGSQFLLAVREVASSFFFAEDA